MNYSGRRFSPLLLYLCMLLVFAMLPSPEASAYSVLSHEETVDLAWSHHIVPLLLERYPNATPDELRIAHSYAYGGCIIQDSATIPSEAINSAICCTTFAPEIS